VIVAIDGPAGAGKSTVARAVARRLGVAYLDTGAMYRALTWLAAQRGVEPGDADALAALARDEPIGIEPTDDGDRVSIAGMDVTDVIRAPEIAARVSEVSAHPGVRARMVEAQRAVMASGSWVSDGRDVGSVVVPGAELKVFLTASLEERARRRHADLAHQGVATDLGRVLEDVRRRDHIDSTRAASPLRVAEGAIVIDSSELDAEEVADLIVRLVEDLRASGEAAG
jgi:cytidylate kinase